jgi:hypothetical protein
MLRDVIYFVTMVGIAAGAAIGAPDVSQRPTPEWYVEVCAEYDVC